MLGSDAINAILFFCILSTTLFAFTSYIVFVIFRVPIYHIIAIYMLYHFVGFVVRPWELYYEGFSLQWDYIGTVPSSGDILWTAIVVVLSHASMLAGFLIVNGKSQTPLIQPFAFRPDRRLAFLAVTLLALLLGAYGLTKQHGDVLSLDRVNAAEVSVDSMGGQRLDNVSGYQLMLADFVPVTIIILFATRRLRIVAILLLVAFVAYGSLAGSTRSAFIATLLAVGCIGLIETRRRFPPIKVVAAAIVVLALFNVLGSDRMAIRRIVNGEVTISDIVDNYFNNDTRGGAPIAGDMQEFDVLTAVLKVVPARSGYTYGTQYIRLLVWPIPRQLWADKPVFTSIVNLMNYANFEYLTTTLYADTYITIGIFGLIPMLVLISMLLNYLYAKVISSRQSLWIMIYICTVMYSPIIFRDGPVSAAYFILVASLGATTILYCGRVRNAVALGRPRAWRESLAVGPASLPLRRFS